MKKNSWFLRVNDSVEGRRGEAARGEAVLEKDVKNAE